VDWTFTPSAAPWASVRAKLVQAVEETCAVIEADAVATAPYRTGRLAKSSETAVHTSTLQGAVGFTDSKAVAAHENMHAHLRHGRRAKFLELSLQENSGVLAEKAAAALRSVFG
jgi:hypothetical protein